MSCDYCEGELLARNGCLSMCIQERTNKTFNLEIYWQEEDEEGEYNNDVSVEIHFCPMCGKKLKEGK